MTGTTVTLIGAFVMSFAAFLFGFEYGITNVMMPIYTRKSFGTKDYATIYSRISLVCSVGSITTTRPSAGAIIKFGSSISSTRTGLRKK